MTVLLNAPIKFWACPSCNVVSQSQDYHPHGQLHPCPALNNLTVPLIEVQHPGDKPGAHHIVNEREDYLGDEEIGPVMSVSAEYVDGHNDLAVYVPTAKVKYQF